MKEIDNPPEYVTIAYTFLMAEMERARGIENLDARKMVLDILYEALLATAKAKIGTRQ